MSNVQISLDGVALREATSQAIMGILTPEVRAQILQKAISHLLTPSTDSWARQKSPIQEAFDQAVSKVAKEVAEQVVKDDPAVMDRLRALAQDVAHRVLNTDAAKLAERMAESFVRSLSSDR
jgi:TRAP-type C4-dicarboxylate transport system substrate-binding protein